MIPGSPQGWSSPRPWRALLILGVGIAVALLAADARRRPAGLIATWLAAVGLAQSGEVQRKPNRLIREKSPYLLQHAYNPVDWRPWGEEALAEARREDKPIFLSIGYSTCHWCHVMERESFEDDSIAALLNRWYIPIKVDREERPDVDRIYMTAMQAMGMGGGWPLNVFLTPGLEPFYGGTYFPPRSLPGHPGMMDVLPRVHEAWTTQRADLERTGAHVLEALDTLARPDTAAAAVDTLIDGAWHGLTSVYDREHGGFGGAPKFPSTVNLDLLERIAARDPARRSAALEMVTRQLDAMRGGGIHDHLGGGFHRYSTDATWLVPHFEKMLYDQALIATAYLEAYQATGNAAYAATARDVFAYVERDLGSREGGFDSAEDADSEGEEGKFYVWTPGELERVLGAEDARVIALRYGVTPTGNFEHGASILHEARSIESVAAELGLEPAEAERRLADAGSRLLAARSQRPRPHRDDKVLVAWNGLMISALARGARVLGEPALARRAARAADFVWERLWNPERRELARRWRDGEAGGQGQLDDYAYYAAGLVELYAATFEPRWLERAVEVTEAQIARFWDEHDGAFFESPAGDPSIRVRMKDGFDGAEMAGNSIAAATLQKLAVLLDRADWRERAARTDRYYARRLAPQPLAMPEMLVAMDAARGAPRHVVIAGDPEAADTRAMIREFDRRFLPGDLLLVADGGERQRRLAALAPFVGPLTRKGGRATAYICVDYACRLPTTDLETFVAQLDARTALTGAQGR